MHTKKVTAHEAKVRKMFINGPLDGIDVIQKSKKHKEKGDTWLNDERKKMRSKKRPTEGVERTKRANKKAHVTSR